MYVSVCVCVCVCVSRIQVLNMPLIRLRHKTQLVEADP